MALALSWHYGFLGIGFIAIIIGVVSFILYKQPPQSVSLNISEPVIPSSPRPSLREVFKGRDFWLVSSAGMFIVSVEFCAITYFVLYLKEVLLFTVVTAGFFLAMLEASGAFGKPLAGLASDRLFHGRRKKVYILMCCIACAMCLIFAFLRQDSPSWIIIPLCLILGFVSIGWGGLHLTLIGEFAGKELAGTATATSSLFLMAGVIAGPPIFGYILDTTGSYQTAWLFLTIMAAVATALLLFSREDKRRI
ncbi:MFS transporter [Chloroflexota bacterium]